MSEKITKTASKKCLTYYLLAALLAIVAIAFIPKQQSKKVAAELIGGDIDLIDQHGQRFRLLDKPKQVSLVFFGFTYCPSFCPIAINQLSKTLTLLPEETLDKVDVLFVTVDPGRDTPTVIADFLENFHPHIKGLTGTEAKIKELVSSYKVYSSKVEVDKDGKAVTESENAHSYIMDHSTYIYLIDEKGYYLTHMDYDADEKEIQKIINEQIND